MSWVIEHLHRDGSVIARVPLPAHAQETDGTVVFGIGRALDNELVLDDPYCAAHHAQLEIDAEGRARLVDLGSANGIVTGRNQRANAFDITADHIYRLGHAQIRIRSSLWPVAAEKPLSRRAHWPLALLMLTLVLAHSGWDLWLGHVQERAPAYLNNLSGVALGLGLWSAAYALFGRLVTGAERFFSHLTIACLGYLAATLLLEGLDALSFAASWLWPMRITQPVIVVVAACTVRFHLRLADPRHWPTLRVALILLAASVIAVPLAQKWITHQRLTDVQVLHGVKHPALRVAAPIPLQEFGAFAGPLKAKVDKARRKGDEDTDSSHDDDE